MLQCFKSHIEIKKKEKKEILTFTLGQSTVIYDSACC